jgi:signal transduction histidine kinase
VPVSAQPGAPCLALGNDAIKRGRIHVQVDLPDFLPPVLAIPGQITQVLLNLVLNAAEAMSDGGRLEISARSEEVYLALLLKNDGPPIPSDEIERLFEPFFTQETAPAWACSSAIISSSSLAARSRPPTARMGTA